MGGLKEEEIRKALLLRATLGERGKEDGKWLKMAEEAKPKPLVEREASLVLSEHELCAMARDFLDEEEREHLWWVVQRNMPAIIKFLSSWPDASVARLALMWIQLLEQERDSG